VPADWAAIVKHGAKIVELVERAAPSLATAENVIDVSATDWAAIQEAASQSPWMPPEYMGNDWVSDVCRFLREGAPAPAADVVPVPRELVFTIPQKFSLKGVGERCADVGHGWNLCVDSLSEDAATFLEWAVERWHAEVAQRPMENVHRRPLDDTWRQVIKRLGGDDTILCGPAHDKLLKGGRP
jgi:hypothetical protein